MKNLRSLVLMQLREKIDLSFLKSKKATIFKVVLSILKFVLICAVIFVGFYLLDFLRLLSILPGIPSNFFVVIFTIMFLLSIFVCTFSLMQNLYFSKENKLLLSFPVSKSQLFTSKLIVFFVYELRRNCIFLLPLFVAYGLINALPFYYFFWIIFSVIVLTAFCVVFSALLSIPTMLVANFLRRVKWLEFSLLGVLLAGVIVGVVFLIAKIPQNIDLIGNWGTIFWQIQEFLEGFSKVCVPFVWLATAVVGNRYGISNEFLGGKQLLIMLGILLCTFAVLGLTYLLVKPLYFKMASSTFEFGRKKQEKVCSNKKLHPFLSAVKKEILLDLRSTEKVSSLLFCLIGLPVAILLLNKIYLAMNTRLMGVYMVIAFNIMIILLFALSTNTAFSKIYSEEGSASYLAKVSPKPYVQVLFAKLVVNLTITSISIVVATAIFAWAVGFVFWKWLLVFLIVEIVFLSHAFWSAELDIMNSQTAYYKTSGSHIANPNEVKSTALTFVLSAIVAFLVFFFIQENQVTVWLKVLFIVLLLFGIRLWLYLNTINVYFKERE